MIWRSALRARFALLLGFRRNPPFLGAVHLRRPILLTAIAPLVPQRSQCLGSFFPSSVEEERHDLNTVAVTVLCLGLYGANCFTKLPMPLADRRFANE